MNELMSLDETVKRVENEVKEQDYAFCQRKMFCLCSKISDIFANLKDTQIGVSIKIINKIDSIDYLKTLARDSKSLYEREEFDNNKNDKLDDNSDFYSLLTQHKNAQWKDVYYIANNLPHKYGYYNSHLSQNKLDTGLIGIVTRHLQWDLPYKSTLIVAVSNNDTDTLYAFLCIDSKKSYCFVKKDIKHLRKTAQIISKLVEISIGKSQQTLQTPNE